MSDELYSEAVRALFDDPQHAGLANGHRVRLDAQGMELELSADVESGSIRALRFRAKACPHVIAACELLCRDFEGSAAASLRGFSGNEAMRRLSVPIEKTGRILVVEDAVAMLADRIEV